jgi:hypothetical protein
MLTVQPDKFNHLLAGYAIVYSISFINPLLAIFLCFVAGIGKEVIWDKALGKGQFEWADMVWTWVGGLMALLPQITYLIKC